MTQTLSFPPLMWGEEVKEDAVGHAARRATLGCDAGLVAYVLSPTTIEVALVFTPEVPLAEAMVMLPLCGIGFQNALGALAPPEVAVHLRWDGGIQLNGAACGQFRVRAATGDTRTVPDWLIVGLTFPLLPPAEDTGLTPDQTALFAEGCADVDPPHLIEAYARHTLNWITRWESDGVRAVHAEWRGLAQGVGEAIDLLGHRGTFLGVDDQFGMLIRGADGQTDMIALTQILETAP